jgi:hypothetical protein
MMDEAGAYCSDLLAQWQDSFDREALAEQEANGDD